MDRTIRLQAVEVYARQQYEHVTPFGSSPGWEHLSDKERDYWMKLGRWHRDHIAQEITLARRRTMALIGHQGGVAGTGKAKARTTKQARAAIEARWRRVRERALEMEG